MTLHLGDDISMSLFSQMSCVLTDRPVVFGHRPDNPPDLLYRALWSRFSAEFGTDMRDVLVVLNDARLGSLGTADRTESLG